MKPPRELETKTLLTPKKIHRPTANKTAPTKSQVKQKLLKTPLMRPIAPRETPKTPLTTLKRQRKNQLKLDKTQAPRKQLLIKPERKPMKRNKPLKRLKITQTTQAKQKPPETRTRLKLKQKQLKTLKRKPSKPQRKPAKPLRQQIKNQLLKEPKMPRKPRKKPLRTRKRKPTRRKRKPMI